MIGALSPATAGLALVAVGFGLLGIVAFVNAVRYAFVGDVIVATISLCLSAWLFLGVILA